MTVSRSSCRGSRATLRCTSSCDEGGDFMPSEIHGTYNAPCPSIIPAARSSHSRKRSPTHIRRPRNSFIIFRSEFCENHKMKENGIENDHRHISRIAAHVWNSLPNDKKKVYRVLAEIEKAAHKAAYPTYRYSPVYRTNQVRRKCKGDSMEDKVRCQRLAELMLAGVKDQAFQQAAKALKKSVVDTELTRQSSQPAPEQNNDDRQLAPCLPAANHEVGINEESPYSSRNLSTLLPLLSSSVAGNGCHGDNVTLAPPGHEASKAEDLDSFVQLALYYLSTVDFSTDTSACSTIGVTEQPGLSVAPSPLPLHGSVGYSSDRNFLVESLPPSNELSLNSPWRPGADKDVLLFQAMEELSLWHLEEVSFEGHLANV